MTQHILAITGKIGSGKSTVSQVLAEQGWAIIDADQIVDDLYQPGERGAAKIQTFFGDEYLKKDGTVSRQKLVRTLLKNTKKWVILNRLIHPVVADEIKRRLHKIQEPKVAIELQIYNERIFSSLFDDIWIIEAPLKTRHQRIAKKFSLPEVEAIEAQQTDLKWPKNATVIKNSGSKNALKSVILQLCPPMK